MPGKGLTVIVTARSFFGYRMYSMRLGSAVHGKVTTNKFTQNFLGGVEGHEGGDGTGGIQCLYVVFLCQE